MFKEGDTALYKNYKEVQVVGIIIPNTIFEIKDMKTDSVHVVPYKDLKRIREESQMKTFNTIKELEQFKPSLAEHLIKRYGDKDWTTKPIFYYENLAEYARHELIDGWYAESFTDKNWNGAPDPLDFIDLESLGKELSSNWDATAYYKTKDNEVIEFAEGW